MSLHSMSLIKATLLALYYSGAGRLLSPLTRGSGVILMLHHVRPEPPPAFAPNRLLTVTPDFLDSVLKLVRDTGFDIIPLDGIRSRLERGGDKPFACFTLDDGYRDNRDYAYPIFKRHEAPFAIYVPTDYPDGKGRLWWIELENVLRTARHLTLDMDGDLRHFPLSTAAEKYEAFEAIYWWLRAIPEPRVHDVLSELALSVGYDASRLCSDLVMTWDEIRALATDPLVTIGAHTCRHFAVAKLTPEEATAEMEDSIRRIEQELGRPCRHFSYPYGSADSAGERDFAIAKALGLETAVTTRHGFLRAAHASDMTALPRLSLNGNYQDARYTDVLLSGAPFAFYEAVRHVARA